VVFFTKYYYSYSSYVEFICNIFDELNNCKSRLIAIAPYLVVGASCCVLGILGLVIGTPHHGDPTCRPIFNVVFH